MFHRVRRLRDYYLGPWLPRAAWRRLRPAPAAAGTRHLIFFCADHFEPRHGGASPREARRRLEQWLTQYPRLAERHRDAAGRSPRHTFFYPVDEADPGELRALVEFCAAGYGEVELQLHHANDTDASLTRLLRGAVERYHAAGALGRRPDGEPAFGFVHGDWALDNSATDAGRSLCGVDNELQVLARAGCYADFTFPALGSTAQPRTINRIYYARDDPQRPKSHDRGSPARAGGRPSGDLLLIPGPLCLNWRRAGRLRPYLEDGDLTGGKGWWPERVDCWARVGVHVLGRPEWLFVKTHTHGAAEANCKALLGRELDALFTDLESRFNDGRRWRLHYVTAREAYNLAKAAEAGCSGDPAGYRDFRISPPEGGAARPSTAPRSRCNRDR